MEHLWGIDLGGTKIEGVVVPKGSTTPLARLRVDTEQDKGYGHILNQIELLVNKLKSETNLNPAKIGIGIPGTIDYNLNALKNSNTQCLNGKPLDKDLAEKLGLPLLLANDANCFALAEATLGAVPQAGIKADVVFGVIMGTGVGGGIVVNGKVINGKQGITGEWGHNFLDESGGPCYCGKSGCVEKVISGPSLQNYYKTLTGQETKLKNIIDAARNKTDRDAEETLDRLLEQFAKGISVVINILDPDAIVLGGGVANTDELYTEGMERVKKYIFNNKRCDTLFLRPALGDSAGVFGAAMLTA